MFERTETIYFARVEHAELCFDTTRGTRTTFFRDKRDSCADRGVSQARRNKYSFFRNFFRFPRVTYIYIYLLGTRAPLSLTQVEVSLSIRLGGRQNLRYTHSGYIGRRIMASRVCGPPAILEALDHAVGLEGGHDEVEQPEGEQEH